MTPEQQDQIDRACALIRAGANPQDLRDLNFAQAAIDAAIKAEGKDK